MNIAAFLSPVSPSSESQLKMVLGSPDAPTNPGLRKKKAERLLGPRQQDVLTRVLRSLP